MLRARFVRLAMASVLSATAWASVFPMNNAFGQVSRRGGRQPAGAAREPVAAQRQNQPLYAFVEAQEHQFVRESINDWSCFTWDHLAMLRQQLASGNIAQLIEADSDFDGVCDAMRRLSPAEREGVYRAALGIYRLTWAQRGHIGPPGQTDAGQQGDILIGRLVVQLVRQRVGQSPQQESPAGVSLKIGDKFRTTADPTPVQVKTTIVATVDAGQEVTAIAINGPWVGVTVIQNGREIHGWIHRENLTISKSSGNR